jgi:hypothetical protein
MTAQLEQALNNWSEFVEYVNRKYSDKRIREEGATHFNPDTGCDRPQKSVENSTAIPFESGSEYDFETCGAKRN